MLSAFLSRRRTVPHPTFGPIRPDRNGRFWRGRASLPHVAGPVDVHIQGDAGPTAAQEKLYQQLAAHFPKVLKVALRGVHREYVRVTQAQPQLKWPAVSAMSELLKLCPLDGVWLDDHHGKRFVLSFQHDQDREHSFHAFFRDWKLESVSSER